MTAELILELRPLMFYTALAMIITVIAMTVDLIAGWRKATIRGDAHTSYAFSRTITKFLMYEGGLLVMLCLDVLLHISLTEYITTRYNVPLCTFALTAVFCVTELWSVREKADQKTRNRINEVSMALARLIGKEQLAKLIETAAEKEKEGGDA